ncbi:MAG TPA: hypothetical protein DCZ95_07660 [Verrucomicrobia bacterium]|nr:MAG: hypothetical protein A2X46_01150 [Lentisphaerae bacterium GWF2_57_35]HBA83951.1 hypothetical protein [Verrucomicrobiota bacterium]
MKRCLGVVLLTLCLTLLVRNAAAVELIRQDDYRLDATNALAAETYIWGDRIDLHGHTLDDVFLLGQTIKIDGETLDDIWVFTDAFVFSGTAREDVRVAARQAVQLTGTFEKNLVVAGKTVSLGPDSLVQGEALLLGESVIVEGHVQGDVHVAAYNATLSGKMDGLVRLYADDIVVLPGAEIHGDLIYTSQKELFLNEKVVLTGKLIRRDIQAWNTETPSYRTILSFKMFFYLAALVAGIPFVSLFPYLTGRAVRQVRKSAWKCALIGVVAFCLIPVLAVLSVLTLIGIPLGLVLAAAYAVMLYVSKFFVALAVGGSIFRWNGPQSFSRVFSALSMGLIALYAATLLPVVGSAVWLVITFMGLGSLLLALFQPPQPPPELRVQNEPQFSVPKPPSSSNVTATKSNGEETKGKE